MISLGPAPRRRLGDIFKFLSCTLELTFKCNCRCPFCYQDNKNSRDLTTQQLFFIFDKLEKHGVMSLIFTGGEPLVRKDFFEIYRYAYQKGFQIGILTNGVNLGLKKYQDFFSRYPPARVMISMNAISERTHEKVTGTRGNFARVLKGVSFLKKKKDSAGLPDHVDPIERA